VTQLDTMFASSTVPRHLVRGVIGLPLMIAAFVMIPLVGGWSLLLLVPSMALLRGCPTCWALGLSQTCALRDADETKRQPSSV